MKKPRINIKCRTCNKVHDVVRTEEIPRQAISLECNWCVECEDKAKDYYQEFNIFKEDSI